MNASRLFGLLLLMNIIACGGDDGSSMTMPDQSECQMDGDCGEGLVCISDQCVLPQCTVDQECNAGLRCIDYRCRFLGGTDGQVITQDRGVGDASVAPSDMALEPVDAASMPMDAGEPDATNSNSIWARV